MSEVYVPTIICGIDPGSEGCLTFLKQSDLSIIQVVPIPKKKGKQDNEAVIKLLLSYSKVNTKACIEEQFILRSQGITSGITTIKNYGILIGILMALGIEVKSVRSQTWQSHHKNTKALVFPEIEALTTKDTKKRSLSLAKTLYPSQTLLPTPRCTKLSDGISDSILIARYHAETIEVV